MIEVTQQSYEERMQMLREKDKRTKEREYYELMCDTVKNPAVSESARAKANEYIEKYINKISSSIDLE